MIEMEIVQDYVLEQHAHMVIVEEFNDLMAERCDGRR